MKEALQLLKQATSEIQQLRRRNELMSARLEMFDSINAMLHTAIAQNRQGMGEDLVFKITKFIKDNEPTK